MAVITFLDEPALSVDKQSINSLHLPRAFSGRFDKVGYFR